MAVLTAIAEKMDVAVVGTIPEGATITTEFEQLPLVEALHRLGPNYGYQLRTEAGTQKVAKIFVLPLPEGFIRPEPSVPAPPVMDMPRMPTVQDVKPTVKPVREPEAGPDREAPHPAPFRFEFNPAALGG